MQGRFKWVCGPSPTKRLARSAVCPAGSFTSVRAACPPTCACTVCGLPRVHMRHGPAFRRYPLGQCQQPGHVHGLRSVPRAIPDRVGFCTLPVSRCSSPLYLLLASRVLLRLGPAFRRPFLGQGLQVGRLHVLRSVPSANPRSRGERGGFRTPPVAVTRSRVVSVPAPYSHSPWPPTRSPSASGAAAVVVRPSRSLRLGGAT